MKQLRVFVIALAILIPVGQAMATQRGEAARTPPPGWQEALRSTLDMTLAGKHDEVIAIYEKWVAKYPDFGDAHSMLCGAYEAKARDLLAKRVPDAGLIADADAALELQVHPKAQRDRTLDSVRGERPESLEAER